MRSKEDIIRLFAQTDPSPKEFSISSRDDVSLQERIKKYQREKLALEVQLDIRDMLQKIYMDQS